MKWEIELGRNGTGKVIRDGVDISDNIVGCHVTSSPGNKTILFLEILDDIKLTLDDPEVQYAQQTQLDVTDATPGLSGGCVLCRDGIPHAHEERPVPDADPN